MQCSQWTQNLMWIESVSAIFGYTNLTDYADLAALHLSNVQQPSYGVLIGCEKSVGILVQVNGLCTVIDSHTHGQQWCSHLIGQHYRQPLNFLFKNAS